MGGVQEIGSNMTLIRTKSEDIIIDCGLLFPYEECFDIRYLIPDFSLINQQQLSSIVITHGHEDHIGGLPHLVERFPEINIYASQFTYHLIQKKFEQLNIKKHIEIYHEKSILKFQDIQIIPCLVNHSIPETFGLVIHDYSYEWGVLYISDFKVDLGSTHETPIELDKMIHILKKCKSTAYFLDSTNILNNGKTPSEDGLKQDLSSLISSTSGRVFVTLFASNIHRMKAIIDLAQKNHRKIVLMGRSIRNYLDAAYKAQLVDFDPEDFLTPDQISNDRDDVLVLISGCQGDFMAALRRFSFGEDAHLKPKKKDLVIFSSKIIPGNEKKIYRIYNKLTESGVRIATASDYLIHSSGHPGKEDIKNLLQNFKPDFYFPIHGESYFLKAHQEFIKQEYPEVRVNMITNYHEVIFRNKDIKIKQLEKKDTLLIHGKGLEILRSDISKRRKMATTGSVFISYCESLNQIQVSFLGVPNQINNSEKSLQEGLIKLLHHELKRDLHGREADYKKEQLRILTRRYLFQILGYKPVTEVHLW